MKRITKVYIVIGLCIMARVVLCFYYARDNHELPFFLGVFGLSILVIDWLECKDIMPKVIWHPMTEKPLFQFGIADIVVMKPCALGGCDLYHLKVMRSEWSDVSEQYKDTKWAYTSELSKAYYI